MKILNRGIILISMFLFIGCFYPFVPYKPSIAFLVDSDHSYAIMEDGKFSRMGINRNDINKMDNIISNKYKIKFSTNAITVDKRDRDIQIKFYDDLKIIVGGKEYILKKENIKINESQNWAPEYIFEDIGIDIRKTDDFEYILDIGEIEIYNNRNGEIIKPRTKIPPILFKKTYYVAIMYNPQGTDYDLYYNGWAEDFPKDTSTLKKIGGTHTSEKEIKFPEIKILSK